MVLKEANLRPSHVGHFTLCLFHEHIEKTETMDGIKCEDMKKSLESKNCYTFLNKNPSPIKRYDNDRLSQQQNNFECGPFCILFAIDFFQCYIIELKRRNIQFLTA